MPTFSTRAGAIQPTGVRKMFDMADEHTIMFGLGEPDFQPPQVAVEACHHAMREGKNKYTTTAGLPKLRALIAESWHHQRPDLSEDNVCMTMSGTNALLNCMLVLVNPGDSVLLPEPYFPLYGPDVVLSGGRGLFYPCRHEEDFIPRLEDLEQLVEPSTKAILVNFPSNPTGSTVTPEQRDMLLDFARRHDLWVITDEVYDQIIFDGPHVSFLTEQYEHVLMVNSFSKTFAMTGWRIGYVLSPSIEAMKQIVKMQYYMTACSNDAMQHAVLTAMTEAKDYPAKMAAAFAERRDLICARLNAMEGVDCRIPRGAFYVFPKVSVGGLSSEDLAMELLKGGILCSPGSAFGPSGEGHLRFAYTTTIENIARGMDLMEMTLDRLR